MSLRRRLENSDILVAVFARLLAAYVWFCFRTTRWRIDGLEDMAAELRDGPVIYVLWHSRVVYGPSAWPQHLARLYTLMDPSPIGRVASRTQAILGMQPISMRAHASNFAASRKILGVIRNGDSVGIAADGPKGPDRDAKQATLEWARATGRPVYLFAWSAKRGMRLKTWDRLIVPLPFTKGAYVFRRWQTDVPRKMDAAGYDNLRADLSTHLDMVTADADRLAGVNR